MTRVLILGGSGHLGSALRAHVPGDIRVFATAQGISGGGVLPFTFGGDETLPSADLVIGSFPLARQVEGLSRSEVDRVVRRYVDRCRGARILQLSTDAVFSGRDGLRSEADPCDASSRYGIAQAWVDEALLAHARDCLLIRTSFIFGFAGARLDKRLAPLVGSELHEVMSWATNVFRSPTDVNFLADAIWRVSGSAAVGLLNIAGERMSVFDFFAGRLQDLGLHRTIRPYEERSGVVAYDTSLRTSRMTDLTSFTAEDSLQWFHRCLKARSSH